MTSSKNEFLAIVFLMFAIVFSSVERTPVSVEEIPPEQSHYAVFYVVCGAVQHVLVTTDPPFLHSMAMAPSQELLDLLEAMPEEQMIELTYEGPECFYSERPAPEKPIL
ncbi:hypothetical protein LCGC14_2572900 [marine sediment metagenome]|uniref:Uncharacterized protein n=1 Tax=marine sediment metagenome TaxID=412755 RepID=A0A0F9B4P0_9ZZZZ